MRDLSDGTPARNLIDAVRASVDLDPSRRALTFLADGTRVQGSWSFDELDTRARAIAATLQRMDAPGERVLIVYPTSLEYVAGFLGCIYAGAYAVPVYPPMRGRFRRSASRLSSIAEDCEAAFALGPPEVDEWAETAPLNRLPSFRGWLHLDTVDDTEAGAWEPPAPKPDAMAFLQYTSGSTGRPKGVMVTHRNLLHNARVHRELSGSGRWSTTVSWLPLYHDMGLIGSVTTPFIWGAEVVLMEPEAFVTHPAHWLEAITRFRGRYTAAPNFALELCLRRIAPDQREGLDLRSMQLFGVAAEPLRSSTLNRFLEAFGPCGLRREAMWTGWGLAEATLLNTLGRYRGEDSTIHVNMSDLGVRRVQPVPAEAEHSRTLVSCGTVAPGMAVAIVDTETGRRCQEGEVGEIWLSGPSVAAGYWLRPDETERVFANRLDGNDALYLATGDLGFLAGGELFITGRLKDMIIHRGQNHYPQDIENTVQQIGRELRPSCGAAFALELHEDEFAVVVQEVVTHREWDGPALLREVRRAVAAEHDLPLDGVFLVKPRSVPKTSSGKLQRRGCREALLAGELPVLAAWRSPALTAALDRLATVPAQA
jgi:acyl-CoA synthetase (AMP-forming)/AMP-acid ligase II